MSWKVTTKPDFYPVTLAQAKEYLRVQHDAEDDIITRCIEAAYDYCEQELDLAILEQTITLKLDNFPQGRTITLPRTNLLSVTSFDYLDLDGDNQSYADYVADEYAIPARIVNNVEDWPDTKDVANAVTIVYQAGFSETETGNTHSTPSSIIQAMNLLITHFYDTRSAVVIGAGVTSMEVQMSVSALLNKYRRLGL
jgi:uncharacterized phiE125 gp8 family phage protein